MFRATALKIVCFALVVVVPLYNEWWCYSFAAWRWPRLSAEADLKLLVVADPQLVGERNEPGGFAGYVTRGDSDRYMRQTFKRAVEHVLPDLIVFLGDLIDEGSIATEDEYARYVARFRTVFPIPDYSQVMYMPGDNDIGGEGPELITDEAVARFERYFGNVTHLRVQFVNFVQVNALMLRYRPMAPLNSMDLRGDYTIAVGHIPLMRVYMKKVDLVMEQLRPSLILSGHSHHSQQLVCERDDRFGGWRGGADVILKQDITREVLTFSLKKVASQWLQREHIVPTCSYRMGVLHMAYAAMTIERNGNCQYALLWLPSRFFPQLALYVVVGVICAIFIAWRMMMVIRRRRLW